MINAHPAFAKSIGTTGFINEPARHQKPNLKIVIKYAQLLSDDDPAMLELNLKQPPGAVEAWRHHVVPQSDRLESWRRSEKMVLYLTTRKRYDEKFELSVDYGTSYVRD